MMRFIKFFDELSKEDVALAGGKGANLGELTKAGFNVPAGFVVLSGVFQSFSSELQQEIDRAVTKIGASVFAVRSSATVEDGKAAAWAGQLETYLNIAPAEVGAAIQKCWTSLQSARAQSYLQQHSDATTDIAVAVVVQTMIPSAVAGVGFSLHPTEQDATKIVIEAVAGLGEVLVSGQATPDNYVLSKQPLGIMDRTIRTARQLLSDNQMIQLAQTIIKIEQHYGFAVDVEWAWANNQFYILQSRPITTVPKQLWSNVNLAEVLPGMNCPLTIDIVTQLFTQGVYELFPALRGKKILSDIKGRLYMNAIVLENEVRNVIAVDNFSITNFLGGAQTNTAVVLPSSWGAKIRLSWFVGKLFIKSVFTHQSFDKQLTGLQVVTQQYQARLNQAQTVSDYITIEQDILTYVSSLLGRAFKALLYPISFYFIFLTVCQKWLKTKDSTTAHTLLATGSNNLQLVEAFSKLWAISRAMQQHLPDAPQQYQYFLQTYGHRCVKEIDISVPRWREDDRFITTMLRNYMHSADKYNPDTKIAALVQRQTAALSAVRRQLPAWKFFVLKKLLHRARSAQHQREYMKSEFIRLLEPLRGAILGIAKQWQAQKILADTNDIFFLKLSEIGQGNPSQYKKIIAQRKIDFQINSKITLPDLITDPDNITTVETVLKIETLRATSLQGIAVSHGIVQGTARVVRSIDEISKLQPGDILVTDHTDPGWTPAFVTIKGLITNTGGLLSHAAIVAREYGLPAIVNVPQATTKIRDGQRLQLNGDSGIIQVL